MGTGEVGEGGNRKARSGRSRPGWALRVAASRSSTDPPLRLAAARMSRAPGVFRDTGLIKF